MTRLFNVLLGLALIAYAISDDPFYGGAPGFGSVQVVIAALGAVLLLIAALVKPAGNTNVFFMAVVSLVMLGATEWIVERVMGPALRRPYDYDEKLLFKLHPGATSVRPLYPENGGGAVQHSINADGFRGPPLDPSHARPRVMVYGDSFIHATYSEEEQTFVRQLGARLERAGFPVEMVNAGVSSYGPDQISLRLETELAAYRPDLLIVSVFAGNDYGDLMRNKIFRLGPDGALEPSPHFLDPEIRTVFGLNRSTSAVWRGLKNIRDQIWNQQPPTKPLGTTPADQARTFDHWVASARKEHEEHVVARDPMVRNTHIDYYSALVATEPTSEAARYEVQLMQQVLRRIVEQAHAAQVPLVFLLIPHPLDVGADFPYASVDRARFPGYEPRNQIAPLVELARTSSVAYLDLFDVYHRHGELSTLYQKAGDDHWSGPGQAVAAEAMAELLVGRGLVPRAVTTSAGSAR